MAFRRLPLGRLGSLWRDLHLTLLAVALFVVAFLALIFVASLTSVVGKDLAHLAPGGVIVGRVIQFVLGSFNSAVAHLTL